MNISIKVNVGPIGLNNTERSTSRGVRYKTQKYKEWAELVYRELNRQSEAIKFFAKQFRPDKEFIVAEYEFGLAKLYCTTGKRKGKLNKKAGDLDNFIKPIQDMFFQIAAAGNGEMDDCYVIALTARKVETEIPYMKLNYIFIDQET